MEIVWTDFAIENLQKIFDYYMQEVNIIIAEKIKKDIFQTTQQLIDNPNSGQIELNLEKLNKNYRYLICGNYKILYRVNKVHVIINDIFDVRQDPVKMIENK